MAGPDERMELMQGSLTVKEQLVMIRDDLKEIKEGMAPKADLEKVADRVDKLEGRVNGVFVGIGAGAAVAVIAVLRGVIS